MPHLNSVLQQKTYFRWENRANGVVSYNELELKAQGLVGILHCYLPEFFLSLKQQKLTLADEACKGSSWRNRLRQSFQEPCSKSHYRTGGWKKLPQLLITRGSLSLAVHVDAKNQLSSNHRSHQELGYFRTRNQTLQPLSFLKDDASAAILTSTIGYVFLKLFTFKLNSHMNKSDWQRLDHMSILLLQRNLGNIIFYLAYIKLVGLNIPQMQQVYSASAKQSDVCFTR